MEFGCAPPPLGSAAWLSIEDDVFHFLLSRISGQLRNGILRTMMTGIFLSAYRKTPIK
jgi:hypothetical protein